MQNPLEQSLEILEQERNRIPALVELVAKSRGETRLLAAKLLQQAVDPSAKNLIVPVQEVLHKDLKRSKPIDILDVLWDLQTNILWHDKPTERVHRIKQSIARYLVETGISEYLPEQSKAWYSEFAACSKSTALLEFFHRWYPHWLEVQFAIEDGFIDSPIDYFRWMKTRPRKFQWGLKTLKRWYLLRQLPPIIRSAVETDPEYRVDLFSPRPQAIVRSHDA